MDLGSRRRRSLAVKVAGMVSKLPREMLASKFRRSEDRQGLSQNAVLLCRLSVSEVVSTTALA